MRVFYQGPDGGKDSGVTGYWLIEWKRVFSIVLLHFQPGSREALHSHAFNALTWWLKGTVQEEYVDGKGRPWWPSWKPKYTPRECFHRVIAPATGAWAISFRGPWARTWKEHKNGETYDLAWGRQRL